MELDRPLQDRIERGRRNFFRAGAGRIGIGRFAAQGAVRKVFAGQHGFVVALLFHFLGDERVDRRSDLQGPVGPTLDPGIDQFLTPDTVQPNGPGTIGYNRYSYASDNPTTLTDPSGHDDLAEYGLIVAQFAAKAVLIITIIVAARNPNFANICAVVAATGGYLLATIALILSLTAGLGALIVVIIASAIAIAAAACALAG